MSPRVRSDPLWLLGSDVTGDQSEGSDVTCLDDSSDVFHELVNGDVQVESDPNAL